MHGVPMLVVYSVYKALCQSSSNITWTNIGQPTLFQNCCNLLCNTHVTCQDNAKKISIVGVFCSAVVDCGPPTDWDNTSVEYSETTIGSDAIFSCLPDYEAINESSATIHCILNDTSRSQGLWETPNISCLGELFNICPTITDFVVLRAMSITSMI